MASRLARRCATPAPTGRAARVWGITAGDEASRAAQAIDRMEAFLQAYGVGAGEAGRQVAERLGKRGVMIGEFGDLGAKEVKEIVALAK